MAASQVCLNIHWNNHQPQYWNPRKMRYELPYVRWHAVKDYREMAVLNERYRRVKMSCDYVPSLLEQMDDYAKNSPPDRFAQIALKDPAQFTAEERSFIYQNFVMENRKAEESPRYVELVRKIKEGRQLSNEELSDLLASYFLIPFPASIKESDKDIAGLYDKGRGFTHEDKLLIFRKLDEYTAEVIPKLRKLSEEGIIEIATAPYYHNLLPLTYNSDAARIQMPWAQLPESAFRHPEDVEEQIMRAVRYHEGIFGNPPTGLWPPEGAISTDIIPDLEKAGIKWIASCQQILEAALGRRAKASELSAPWKIKKNGSSVISVFRDYNLSRHIGFDYQHKSPFDAVNEMMWSLGKIRDEVAGDPGTLKGRPPLVSIILDGENAWEYYPNNGWDFLNELFSRLEKEEGWLKTMTVPEYLRLHGCPEENELGANLKPGSWVEANFSTWIGSPDTNKAWGYLAKTREALSQYVSQYGSVSWQKVEEATRLMLAAEGSDWMWWYSGRNFSMQALVYDGLFRDYQIRIYEIIEHEIPTYLNYPLFSGQSYGNGGRGAMQR